MASIRRLSEGRWQVTWYEGRYAGPDGKMHKRQRSRIVRGTYRDAQKAAAEIEAWRAPARQGEDPNTRTVGRACAKWLTERGEDVLRNTLELGTWRRYEMALRVHVLPAFENLPLRRLQPEHVEDLYRSLPPATAQTVHTALRQVLRWALRQKWIGWDVEVHVRPPSYRIPEKEPIPLEHAAAILQAFRKQPYLRRWFALVALAYATGMRRGELFGLHWDDIDWQDGLVWVRQALKQSGRIPLIGDTKTHRQRFIKLGRETLAILRWHRILQRHERPKWEKDLGLVFPATNGNAMSMNNFRRRIWLPVLEDLGLPPYGLHQMRHTQASELAGGDEPVGTAALARRLGDNPVTVFRRYAHALSRDDLTAAEKADRLLRQALTHKEDGQVRARVRAPQGTGSSKPTPEVVGERRIERLTSTMSR